MILRELFVKLGLNVDEASFAKGQLAADAVKAGLGALVNIATEAVSSFLEFVKTTAEAGKEIHETAQSTGLTTRALQEMRGAAKATGVEVGDMDMALFRMSRSMWAAHKGGAGAADSFSRLHVKVNGANGKLRTADDVMMDLADKFSKMPDGAEKTATAMEFFGRSGARLIPMLNQGREGLQKYRDAAFVMTEEQIGAGRSLTMTWAKLGGLTKKIWTAAIAPLLPEIDKLLKAYLAWRQEGAKILSQRIATVLGGVVKVIGALGLAFKAAVKVVSWATEHWKLFAAVLGGVVTAMMVANASAIGAMVVQYGAMGVAAVAAGAKAAAAWLAAVWPIALIAVGVAAVVLLFEDVYQALTGGESVIGDQFNAWKKGFETLWNDPRFASTRAWIEGIEAQFKAGINGAKDAWAGFSAMVGAEIDQVKARWDQFVASIEPVIKLILQATGGDVVVRQYDAAKATAANVAARERREAFVGPMQPFVGPMQPSGPTGGVGGAVSSAWNAGMMNLSLANREPTVVNWERERSGQVKVMAPSLNFTAHITPAPGQSPEEIAKATQNAIDTWFNAKMEEAAAHGGG